MNRRTNVWFAVMAGGIGSRFWPASRPDRPKQLLSFGSGTTTLLREAVDRAAVIAGRDHTLIVTSESLQQHIRQHVDILPERNVLAEPAKRNTLGAILYATAAVLAEEQTDEEETVLGILPADHFINGRVSFTDDVSRAVATAYSHDALVTIGIPPTRPETGYGYIEAGSVGSRLREVVCFREKPDLQTARSFLRKNCYLWNSGMFFWRIGTFMDELNKASPQVAATARELFSAFREGSSDEVGRIFSELPDTSIDYTLMEDAQRVKVVTASFEWDDLGSWDALARVSEPDGDGNVLLGPAVLTDCKGCVVYNELADPIAAMGLEDMVVAVGRGGILVTPINRAQGVRELSRHAAGGEADLNAAHAIPAECDGTEDVVER